MKINVRKGLKNVLNRLNGMNKNKSQIRCHDFFQKKYFICRQVG